MSTDREAGQRLVRAIGEFRISLDRLLDDQKARILSMGEPAPPIPINHHLSDETPVINPPAPPKAATPRAPIPAVGRPSGPAEAPPRPAGVRRPGQAPAEPPEGESRSDADTKKRLDALAQRLNSRLKKAPREPGGDRSDPPAGT
jgi:hypothetical protein